MIKFTVDAGQLNKALKMSSIVSPQITASQERGFLFVVDAANGVCQIYSTNERHEVRSSFPISDVEGEGSFMYPADYVGEFDYISDPITFTADQEGEAHKVRCTFGVSGEMDRVSFDPRSTESSEESIKKVVSSQEPKVFNIKILQLAFGMAKPFAIKATDKTHSEHYKTIQIFGDENPELAKKANGYLISSNSIEHFYFQSDAFKGKGLAVPGEHLPFFESFMSQSSGFIKVYTSDSRTYVINENNDAIGWPHHEDVFSKFSYYTKDEPVITKATCKSMFYQLRFMRAGLNKDKSKIRFHFNPSSSEVWFSSVDEGNTRRSLPIQVETVVSKIDKELSANANVNHMLHLFEDAQGDWVEFRITILPPNERRPKESFFFRTIDEFTIGKDGSIGESLEDGAHLCTVTRFTPGID